MPSHSLVGRLAPVRYTSDIVIGFPRHYRVLKLALRVREHVFERVSEDQRLRLVADDACLQSPYAAGLDTEGARPGPFDEVCLNQLGLALHEQWLLELHIEHSPHIVVGVMSDQDTARVARSAPSATPG